MLTVRFEDFWGNFQPADFFLPLLGRSLGEEIRVVAAGRTPVDIRVRSVFPSRFGQAKERVARKGAGLLRRPQPRLHGPARLNLWYTGENRRPPTQGYDLTMSFDVDSYAGSNVYLPLLVVRALQDDSKALSEGSKILGVVCNPAMLHQKRVSSTAQRSRFACLITGNPEPTRMRFVEALRQIGDVDVFGPAVGNPVPDKAHVGRQYRYMICFENSFYPGYITEKLLDAWLLECVPLWCGNDRAQMVNEAARLNLWDFASMESLVERVAHLERNPQKINEIAGSALLTNPLDISSVESAIRNAWEKAPELPRRRRSV